jgi:hypothetical protein
MSLSAYNPKKVKEVLSKHLEIGEVLALNDKLVRVKSYTRHCENCKYFNPKYSTSDELADKRKELQGEVSTYISDLVYGNLLPNFLKDPFLFIKSIFDVSEIIFPSWVMSRARFLESMEELVSGACVKEPSTVTVDMAHSCSKFTRKGD